MQPRDPVLLRQRQAQLAREHRDELIQKWEKSIPSEYLGHKTREITDDAWNSRLDREGVRELRRYLKEPTKFLLLYGSKGTGKSTLAATIVRRLIADYSMAGMYRTAPLLLHSFSWRDRDSDPLGEAIHAPILLIDDLGAAAERKTDTQTQALWSLINDRWGNEKKLTLLTTNMPLTKNADGLGLIQWLGDTAWDRISGDLTSVDLEGTSQRTS